MSITEPSADDPPPLSPKPPPGAPGLSKLTLVLTESALPPTAFTEGSWPAGLDSGTAATANGDASDTEVKVSKASTDVSVRVDGDCSLVCRMVQVSHGHWKDSSKRDGVHVGSGWTAVTDMHVLLHATATQLHVRCSALWPVVECAPQDTYKPYARQGLISRLQRQS